MIEPVPRSSEFALLEQGDRQRVVAGDPAAGLLVREPQVDALDAGDQERRTS